MFILNTFVLDIISSHMQILFIFVYYVLFK